MVVLRADPWTPDYGMGFEARVDETPGRADPFVETDDWSAPRPVPPAEAGTVRFVDGVRRVELRLLADDGDRRAYGLFGSFAVGCVRCEGRASFDEHRIGRALVVGSGVAAGPVEVPLEGGTLRFEPAAEPLADPDAPLQRLQALMREAEDVLCAAAAAAGAPLVLADGPLRLGEPVPGPIVGVVKRTVRRYLEPEHEALLPALVPGTRTPVFGLLDQEDALRGYGWYTRLVPMRAPWHDLAGIVRCEVRAAHGIAGATELADRVAGVLPSFAGRPSDPRAPQNLAPIGGLEAWLRHRLGHPGIVRRALTGWLIENAGEAA